MTVGVKRVLRDNEGEANVRARLLLVIAEPLLAKSLTDVLTMEGYRVDTASDELQAVIMLATRRYDLVITEVNKLEVHSLKLLWTIRNRYPNLEALVITGYETIEIAEEAVKMGAFRFLVKPIIDDEILDMIQKALKQRAPSLDVGGGVKMG